MGITNTTIHHANIFATCVADLPGIRAGYIPLSNGWYWQEHHGVGHCFFFSQEQVTKNDAEILCSFHEGYLVEIDRVASNYWIKSMLLELYTPDVDAKVPWG